ncbi:kinase-like domain-containing protein [Mycena belliarum]|uniref:Kinase-like domain-containing protein n=1 Tax=Mycena belliarum TaxID=1033014 RepID=A0AAD6XHN3_9AGAR|nr:kinase-like domain-containing protein [Mycena belliae]
MTFFNSSGAGAGSDLPALPDLTGTYIDDGFLQLVKLLGRGTNAMVYRALETTSPEDDPTYYAIKCMHNDVAGSQRVLAICNEYNTHKALSYQQGVTTVHKILRGGEDGQYAFIVMEEAPSTVHDAITSQVYVREPARAPGAMLNILDSVRGCHARGVYHRDVKPANLLCSARGTSVKLADFGAVTRDSTSSEFGSSTSPYRSPESLDSSRASYSNRDADLWAVSMTLFAMVTGDKPWAAALPSDAGYALYRADEDAHFIETFNLTPAAAAFFRWCFAPEPRDRPTLDEMSYTVMTIPRFTRAHTAILPRSSAAALSPPRQVAPDYRVVDRRMQNVATRQRLLKKMRRA